LITPKTASNYTIGLLAGILVPLLILILLDFFNSRIITRKDVENFTALPIVGTIGHNKKKSLVPVFEFPKSLIAESFRLLRSNLQYLLIDQNQRTVMVTSTVSGEGKNILLC